MLAKNLVAPCSEVFLLQFAIHRRSNGQLTIARLQHRFERLFVGQAVIITDFNELLRWQAAVGWEFLRVAEGNYIVFSAVKDDCAQLDGRGRAAILPCRATSA